MFFFFFFLFFFLFQYQRVFIPTYSTWDHETVESSLAKVLGNSLPLLFVVALWIKRRHVLFSGLLWRVLFFSLHYSKGACEQRLREYPNYIVLRAMQSWYSDKGNHSCGALLLLLAQMPKQMEGQELSAEMLQIANATGEGKARRTLLKWLDWSALPSQEQQRRQTLPTLCLRQKQDVIVFNPCTVCDPLFWQAHIWCPAWKWFWCCLSFSRSGKHFD